MVLILIVLSYLSSSKLHSMHPSTFSAGGRGVWFEPSTRFSKRRGLTGSQRVVAEKDSGEFFQGVAGGCKYHLGIAWLLIITFDVVRR